MPTFDFPSRCPRSCDCLRTASRYRRRTTILCVPSTSLNNLVGWLVFAIAAATYLSYPGAHGFVLGLRRVHCLLLQAAGAAPARGAHVSAAGAAVVAVLVRRRDQGGAC
ncbi:MAG: hypothetical protein WKG07_20110 [Hymenobacter sp.]